MEFRDNLRDGSRERGRAMRKSEFVMQAFAVFGTLGLVAGALVLTRGLKVNQLRLARAIFLFAGACFVASDLVYGLTQPAKPIYAILAGCAGAGIGTICYVIIFWLNDEIRQVRSKLARSKK